MGSKGNILLGVTMQVQYRYILLCIGFTRCLYLVLFGQGSAYDVICLMGTLCDMYIMCLESHYVAVLDYHRGWLKCYVQAWCLEEQWQLLLQATETGQGFRSGWIVLDMGLCLTLKVVCNLGKRVINLWSCMSFESCTCVYFIHLFVSYWS